jgi:Uma2 family endonuclease
MDRLFSEVKRRLSFYQGTIELRMPGQDYEVFSGIIAFLLGLYCLDKGIWFLPTESFTQKKPPESAAEADASYCFGSRKPIPDLAIEIIVTSGSDNKLLKYQAILLV